MDPQESLEEGGRENSDIHESNLTVEEKKAMLLAFLMQERAARNAALDPEKGQERDIAPEPPVNTCVSPVKLTVDF